MEFCCSLPSRSPSNYQTRCKRLILLLTLGVLFGESMTSKTVADQMREVWPRSPKISMTLIPPSPVTDRIELEIRGTVYNERTCRVKFDISVYLDEEQPEALMCQQAVYVGPESIQGITMRWPTRGRVGKHHLRMVARSGGIVFRDARPLEILDTGVRSTRRLGGAWVDIYHHDPGEDPPFRDELGKMTPAQWRELVRAMHEVDQNLLVVTMMFQNFTHVGKHQIEKVGYHGKAYYPSKLYPGRMPIASNDPLEAILDEAEKLGVHVMPGVGCYAFFDFTASSLAWHKRVADELWQRYGHHRSFYGWYVSEEIAGNLGSDDIRRQQLVDFFCEFRAHVRQFAPGKPIMLATNSHFVKQANGYYEKLLPHLDILCPFGFHRMPPGDITGAEAARYLQDLCNRYACHLWMDMETFVFRNGSELHLRPILGLVSDLQRFPNFEKILHYQFPGMMSSPRMSRQPGGEASVQLYLDYQRFLSEGQAPEEDKKGQR